MFNLRARCFLIFLALVFFNFSGGEWERVSPSIKIIFPKDHGAHFNYQTEWWYATGEAADAHGRRFGYQFTIFRRGISNKPIPESASAFAPRHIFAGHIAVTNVSEGKLVYSTRMRRQGGGFVGASEEKLDVYLENWEAKMKDNNTIVIAAEDGESGISINLELKATKAPALHGVNGYSKKGPQEGNASAYVSFTRMITKGTIGVGGEKLQIVGESWFDHEWATSQLAPGVAGWDWFGLRLDDGREMMLYGMRRAPGDYLNESAGTIINKDGSTRSLTKNDFTFEVLNTWKSPRTGAVYPSRWRVRVPSEKFELDISAKVNDAELDTRETTGIVYWEGPVSVKTPATGQSLGEGYMELTGYLSPLGGKL